MLVGFFSDTLTSNNILYGVMSDNLSFTLTIKLFAKRLNIWGDRATALSLCLVLIENGNKAFPLYKA
jgi:hypothetical protein